VTGPEFHETRAGRTFYEHTLPELVRQVERLATAVEQLLAEMRAKDGKPPGRNQN
jgi:hypothetical protein